MPRVALFTGSFDPITNGHVAIVAAAAGLFDRIVVAIGTHPGKQPMFSVDERRALLAATFANTLEGDAEIVVATFDGLSVEAARAHGATAIVRGVRNGADCDYEMTMAGMNGTMSPHVQTIFLPAPPAVRHITATLVRQIAAMGGDPSPFVPAPVAAAMRAKVGAAAS